ncbi:alkaline phosphatase family protein [Sphingomonas oligophenolica]|uniref:Alkaline phosphatase n=1 Tax=Sphingomonas oligophenolica TaxID=301154 RepID=A0A502CKG9_9SPHN|nr:alkaline phosphatase family protein [Sphingomonas oligophenolica]TPG13070.1 alkaline phosphatase family protein [Sphingomonas oligophenolica]
MKPVLPALFAATMLAVTPVAARDAPVPPHPAEAQAPATRPKLIVAISVDQFSADLFAQYRAHFTGGFKRLLTGVVFPSGYQSHAATETCPGHSTILTGMRPAHTGIVANNWIDQSVSLTDKVIYCAEDESVPGSTHDKYTVTDKHLKVPTLGEMMKAADPRIRVVSVAGKDRAAVMMGGHKVDELWWWDGERYTSYSGRAEPAVLTRANTAIAALVAHPQAPLPLPAYCQAVDRPIRVGDQTLGTGRFARAAGDLKSFRASPAADAATLSIAAGLIQSMRLGTGPQTDIIAIGESATDYIGHAYGTQGSEMCIQLDQLDQALGSFFATLDGWGLDYEVVLTADHGAHDMTERQQAHAMPMESRAAPALATKAADAAVAKQLGLTAPVLMAAEGDIYIDAKLPAATRTKVSEAARAYYAAQPQVAAAFPRAEIAATPMPSGPPETWTLIQRARASFDPARSGDLLVLLKPRATTIETPGPGYVETHGSPWDYDRRVPILFWRKGMAGFEQPLSVETVDIAPTLAATIGLPVHGLDGRCLDLDVTAATTCPQ